MNYVKVNPSALRKKGNRLITLAGQYRDVAKSNIAAKDTVSMAWKGEDANAVIASLSDYVDQYKKFADRIEGIGLALCKVADEYDKAYDAVVDKAR